MKRIYQRIFSGILGVFCLGLLCSCGVHGDSSEKREEMDIVSNTFSIRVDRCPEGDLLFFAELIQRKSENVGNENRLSHEKVLFPKMKMKYESEGKIRLVRETDVQFMREVLITDGAQRRKEMKHIGFEVKAIIFPVDDTHSKVCGSMISIPSVSDGPVIFYPFEKVVEYGKDTQLFETSCCYGIDQIPDFMLQNSDEKEMIAVPKTDSQ